MRTYSTFILSLFASLALASCGGGGNTTTPPAPTGPEAEARVAAIESTADATSADLSAEISVASMISFQRSQPALGDLDDCTTFVGTFGNGTLTFDECDTRRGFLNGTITWSGNVIDGWTSVQDLSFRRGNNGRVLTVVGTADWDLTHNLDGSRTIRRIGTSTSTRPGERIESSSDLRWTWTQGDTGLTRTYPVGTASIDIYHGNGSTNNLVHELDLTFDGTSTVLAVINGEEYSFSLLSTIPPRFKKFG